MATQIPQAPPVPQLGSSTFDDDMKAFHRWEKDQLQPYINQATQEVENNINTVQSLKNETEQLKNDTQQLKNDTQNLKDETAQFKSDCEQIKTDVINALANGNFTGDWVGSKTYSVGESVKYNGKLFISTVDNNTDIPGTSDKWFDTVSNTAFLQAIIFG